MMKFVVKKTSNGQFRFNVGRQQRSGRRHQRVLHPQELGDGNHRLHPEERRISHRRRRHHRLTGRAARQEATDPMPRHPPRPRGS
jgi:hypothetical protein